MGQIVTWPKRRAEMLGASQILEITHIDTDAIKHLVPSRTLLAFYQDTGLIRVHTSAYALQLQADGSEAEIHSDVEYLLRAHSITSCGKEYSEQHDAFVVSIMCPPIQYELFLKDAKEASDLSVKLMKWVCKNTPSYT